MPVEDDREPNDESVALAVEAPAALTPS